MLIFINLYYESLKSTCFVDFLFLDLQRLIKKDRGN